MSDPLSPQDLAVRREILRALARDVAVTRVSVMQALGCGYAEVSASYARLAAAHVVVLDADTGEVWMALPFSAVPTPFRVVAGDVAVWANCAWDAFGIAAALECDVSFATPCPGSGAVIAAGVRHGTAYANPGVVAHVGVPAAQWWDDIGFTWSTIRLFRSEEDIATWSASTGVPVGAVVPVPQLAALGRRWYRGRMAPDWRPRTLAESQALLASTGFTGPFWSLTPEVGSAAT